MKKLIPKPTLEQLTKAFKGELVELIPGKKGYRIILSGKHYKYVK